MGESANRIYSDEFKWQGTEAWISRASGLSRVSQNTPLKSLTLFSLSRKGVRLPFGCGSKVKAAWIQVLRFPVSWALSNSLTPELWDLFRPEVPALASTAPERSWSKGPLSVCPGALVAGLVGLGAVQVPV